jgi:hypothetical protein
MKMIALLKKQKENNQYSGRGVKNMKNILILMMALALVGVGLTAASADPISNYSQTIVTVTNFNPFGIAIGSTSTTTTTTTTYDSTTPTETYTSIDVSVATSTWHGGGLKVDTVYSTNTGTGSDGSTSTSTITDTYVYDNSGNLLSVSGTGTVTSYDEATGQTSTGTIIRTFIVKDGQALMTSSVTTGTITDKDGKEIGTFTNTTTIAEEDYEYLGGNWVPMKVTNVSYSNTAQSTSTVTRITTYTRDSAGTITGLSQTATGTLTTHNGGGTQNYTLEYSAVAAFDAYNGWYISQETMTWNTVSPPVPPAPQHQVREPREHNNNDPVIYGEIIGTVIIDGVTYLQVAAEYVDILDGQGLQEANGEIFLVACTDAELALLEGMVGQQVMLMGDIAGALAGAAIFDINPNYGGGIKTDVPQGTPSAQALENLYQGESWYQQNLSVMADIWHGVQVDWAAGIQQLINLAAAH